MKNLIKINNVLFASFSTFEDVKKVFPKITKTEYIFAKAEPNEIITRIVTTEPIEKTETVEQVKVKSKKRSRK